MSVRSDATADEFVPVEDGDCVYINDDFPLYGVGNNELTEASWAQMESDTASNELLAVTNINAPVNSDKALSKVYPLLKRVAYPIDRIHRSVCIGTWRLTFRVEYLSKGPVVYYNRHHEVIKNMRGPEYTRMYMFVRSPITMPIPFICPIKITVDSADRVINNILKPLRDDQKLDFLYRISRVLTDPVTDPSVIVFYGPSGHEGKTTLAKNLTRLLIGAVMWSSEDLIGSKSKWPSVDVVMKLCEQRVLICDECEIEDGFSYQHIKRWTSDAPVSFGGRTGFLSQMLIVVSNKIPF
ncbi:hypothetical protein F5Y03DRAFT_400884 [Xylaria venustula]|nr:hypothetical protein F5Y03DRAFT_400884 [Xylaria venustula]